MRYSITTSTKEFLNHSIRQTWFDDASDLPWTEFLEQEYNIRMVYWATSGNIQSSLELLFESEQDYILWQLYQ